MKVIYSFLAKAGEVSADGSFAVLGGGLEAVVADSFPAVVPCLMFLGKVEFDDAEAGAGRSMTVRILDASGKSVLPVELTQTMVPEAHPDSSIKKLRAGFAAQFFGLSFPSAGEYRFTMNADGNVVAANSLFLVKGPLTEEKPI